MILASCATTVNVQLPERPDFRPAVKVAPALGEAVPTVIKREELRGDYNAEVIAKQNEWYDTLRAKVNGVGHQ